MHDNEDKVQAKQSISNSSVTESLKTKIDAFDLSKSQNASCVLCNQMLVFKQMWNIIITQWGCSHIVVYTHIRKMVVFTDLYTNLGGLSLFNDTRRECYMLALDGACVAEGTWSTDQGPSIKSLHLFCCVALAVVVFRVLNIYKVGLYPGIEICYKKLVIQVMVR